MLLKSISGAKLDYIRDRNGSLGMILEIPDVDEKSIIYYQIEMINQNLFQVICDLSISFMDHRLSLVYNTSGKQSLAALKEQKDIGSNELQVIFRNIIRVILRAERYLLNLDNFLLNKEVIFVNPESFEVSLIYIPLELNDSLINKADHEKMIVDELMEMAEDCGMGLKPSEASNPGEASLEGILSRLNDISFNIPEDITRQAAADKGKQLVIRQENGAVGNKPRESKTTVNSASIFSMFSSVQLFSFESSSKKLWLGLAAFVSIQLAAIVIMLIYKDSIRSINPENTAVTYGLFGLILAGINTLVIRRLTK